LQALPENKDANVLQWLPHAQLDQHNTTINNKKVICKNKHARQKDETLLPIILFKASKIWPTHRPTHDIFFSMNESVRYFVVTWAMKLSSTDSDTWFLPT
jgi:hypothetical protein